MKISRRFILVIGLVGIVLTACSPDDSAAIRTQTQDANNAFNTRVAAAQQSAEGTQAGQDVISALALLNTEQLTPTEAAPLPASATVEAAPPTSAVTEMATLTPVEVNLAAPTLILPTDTPAATLIPPETQAVQAPTLIPPPTDTPAPTLIPPPTDTPAPTTAAPDILAATTPAPDVVERSLTQAAAFPTPTHTVTSAPTLAPTNTSTPLPQSANSAALTQGITVFAAFDGGVIEHLTSSFAPLGQFSAGAAGAMGIDGSGNLYVGNTTSILVIPEICSADTVSLGNVVGVDAGLAQVGGIEVAEAPDRLLVVDSSESAPALVAFTRNAGGVPTVDFRTTNLAGKRPWGLAYDAVNDRLYAATTDGNVLVFDRYYAQRGAIPPTRIITPFDASGAQQVSTDLRGIVYVPAADALILSDVGGTSDPNDGQLLILDGASQANGNIPVRAQIRGAKTHLGAPDSLAFDGTSLYVAENFNGYLLRYDNILAQSGVLDLEANSVSSAPHVRSVAVASQNPGANPVCSPATTAVPTPMPSQTAQGSATLSMTSPQQETSPPPTQVSASEIPTATPAPITQTPPAATSIPPTQPATSAPPTATPASPTQPPPSATLTIPTQAPPSATQAPPTAPATDTPAPPTPQPTNTPIPPTQPPATPVPPTAVPATQAPTAQYGGGKGTGKGSG